MFVSQHRLDCTTLEGLETLEFWEDAFEGNLKPSQLAALATAVKPLGNLSVAELQATIGIVCGKSRANVVYEQEFLTRLRSTAAPMYVYGSHTTWPAPEPPVSHKGLVDEMCQPLLSSISLFGSSPAGSGTRVILLVPIK